MALTATISSGISISGININGSVQISDGEAVLVNNDIAANNTTEVLSIAFDKAKLRGIFFVSNIAANVTFGGVGNPALQLVAGVPFVWHDTCGSTNPFGNNCTNITCVNNNATNAAAIQGIIVKDPT
jgi:hypothetical protein